MALAWSVSELVLFTARNVNHLKGVLAGRLRQTAEIQDNANLALAILAS